MNNKNIEYLIYALIYCCIDLLYVRDAGAHYVRDEVDKQELPIASMIAQCGIRKMEKNQYQLFNYTSFSLDPFVAVDSEGTEYAEDAFRIESDGDVVFVAIAICRGNSSKKSFTIGEKSKSFVYIYEYRKNDENYILNSEYCLEEDVKLDFAYWIGKNDNLSKNTRILGSNNMTINKAVIDGHYNRNYDLLKKLGGEINPTNHIPKFLLNLFSQFNKKNNLPSIVALNGFKNICQHPLAHDVLSVEGQSYQLQLIEKFDDPEFRGRIAKKAWVQIMQGLSFNRGYQVREGEPTDSTKNQKTYSQITRGGKDKLQKVIFDIFSSCFGVKGDSIVLEYNSGNSDNEYCHNVYHCESR
jgi:hypothetical protein